MFVSRDGVAWRNVVGPSDGGGATYDGVALSGDRAVLLGTVAVGDDAFGAVWTARAALFEP
jgi:hypothetical protein